MELICQREWEQVRNEIHSDGLIVRRSVIVQGFLGSDVDCRITPLHQACSYNAPISIVEALHELDPSFLLTRDSAYKRLPLHVSLIASASDELVSKLIELDISTAQGQDILGRFPLHYACNHGVNLQVIESLVISYPQAVLMPDENGWLPLHIACRFGMPLIVIQLLLSVYPASIHMKTSNGTTALSFAQRNKHDELIKFLQSTTTSTSRRSVATPLYQWKSPAELEIANFVDLDLSVDTFGIVEIYQRGWYAGSSSSVVSSLTDVPPFSSNGPSKAFLNLRFLFSPRVVSS